MAAQIIHCTAAYCRRRGALPNWNRVRSKEAWDLQSGTRLRLIGSRPAARKRLTGKSGFDGFSQHNADEASPYSITSSARASSEAGMSIPRFLVVLRLMVILMVVDWTNGMSPAFVPRRSKST